MVKQSASKGKKNVTIDIAAMIGPQKISQWMQQISQVESFGNYLESKFDYLEELNQGK